jgi:hypothetical protein
MPEIILTEEQAKVLIEARENVILRDEAGTVRIVSEPFDAIALANHHRRKSLGVPVKGMSGEQVQELFEALEAEKERAGKIDAARAQEILARFRAEKAA